MSEIHQATGALVAVAQKIPWEDVVCYQRRRPQNRTWRCSGAFYFWPAWSDPERDSA